MNFKKFESTGAIVSILDVKDRHNKSWSTKNIALLRGKSSAFRSAS